MISLAPEHQYVKAGSIRLHVVLAGPAGGKPVMLLHGFPDFWIGWRRQIDALASAGYRVIVPDQRGYNTSDKPKGIREYTLLKLLGDVVALADALGIGRFHLGGHDWGGIVAWAAGAKLPHRLDKLVILNAPYPDVLFAHALRSPTQFLRSSYAVFFQIPFLPEVVLGARRSALLARALRKSGREGAFEEEETAEYRQAWELPGRSPICSTGIAPCAFARAWRRGSRHRLLSCGGCRTRLWNLVWPSGAGGTKAALWPAEKAAENFLRRGLDLPTMGSSIFIP